MSIVNSPGKKLAKAPFFRLLLYQVFKARERLLAAETVRG